MRTGTRTGIAGDGPDGYCRRVPTEPLRCAGALIVDDDGRIFIQRRSPDRRLFPNCWDIVGGHLEPGEEIDDALRREVTEETGWAVSHVLGLVGEYRYTADDGLTRVETDFLIRVDGDLSRPRLEAGKHTEFRWLAERDIALLDEHRDVNDGLIRRIAEDGFAALRSIGLTG
ncbi:NUDIX domain-containing protein [Micromonospora sp. BL1]|uniref:NUDIX hydrolase n=1 Tax=Micromonospora tulbaghiae TaxID=479978 RepID=A0A386WRF5_9ACTN|nr:NUDIX hydrolase [Micromonospora tulbaghiae]MBC9004158.1 NUDIX domain-containing protein [Micromonospora aurantiaca]NED51600.1 NUDIX domain-containing protein [Micromonospora aurantiaca]RLQ09410.1 NUDIX domain-containing protein [Micromonospora sp. BL1]